MPALSKISTFSKEVIYPETELKQISDMTEFMRNANTKNDAKEVKELLGLADGAVMKSPILEGIPIAPTAPLGTNTNQIATTAFVIGMLSGLMESVPEVVEALTNEEIEECFDTSYHIRRIDEIYRRAGIL